MSLLITLLLSYCLTAYVAHGGNEEHLIMPKIHQLPAIKAHSDMNFIQELHNLTRSRSVS